MIVLTKELVIPKLVNVHATKDFMETIAHNKPNNAPMTAVVMVTVTSTLDCAHVMLGIREKIVALKSFYSAQMIAVNKEPVTLKLENAHVIVVGQVKTALW